MACATVRLGGSAEIGRWPADGTAADAWAGVLAGVAVGSATGVAIGSGKAAGAGWGEGVLAAGMVGLAASAALMVAVSVAVAVASLRLVAVTVRMSGPAAAVAGMRACRMNCRMVPGLRELSRQRCLPWQAGKASTARLGGWLAAVIVMAEAGPVVASQSE